MIALLVMGIIYYFYKMGTKNKGTGTPQCCDINYTNYNESCLTNTDCICDQEICANTGDARKSNFNTN